MALRPALLPAAATALLAASALATGAAPAPRPDPVVVRVGPTELRASEVARRFGALPDFQRRALGEPRRALQRFVEEVLVVERLHALEAERAALARSPRVRHERDRELARAVERAILATLSPPSAEEIAAYRGAHLAEFERPARVRLARILVADRPAAEALLAELRAPGGVARFGQLARERSLDEATRLRAGALGFVHPDGRTDVPQVEVDPALPRAAAAVRDGELVPEPVPEGERFAVVWRRGSLPAVQVPHEVASRDIAAVLLRERAEVALQALLRDLAARHVAVREPAPLELLPPAEAPRFGGPPPGSAAPAAPAAPGASSAAPPAAPWPPVPTERGSR